MEGAGNQNHRAEMAQAGCKETFLCVAGCFIDVAHAWLGGPGKLAWLAVAGC